MNNTQSSSQSSQTLGSLIALAFALSLLGFGGCRFGNNSSSSTGGTDENTGNTKNGPSSGYKDHPEQLAIAYPTETRALRFCYMDITENVLCSDRTAEETPPLVAEVFRSGTIVSWENLETSHAKVQHPDFPNHSMPITLDAESGQFEFQGSSKATTLWLDVNCRTQTKIKIEGLLKPTEPRLLANVQVTQVFDGPCADSMRGVQNCIADLTQCEGETPEENEALHEIYSRVFGIALGDNGVPSEQWSSTRAFAYTSVLR